MAIFYDVNISSEACSIKGTTSYISQGWMFPFFIYKPSRSQDKTVQVRDIQFNLEIVEKDLES